MQSPLLSQVSVFQSMQWTDKEGKQKSGYTFAFIDTLSNVLINNDQSESILQVRAGNKNKSDVLTFTPAGVWPAGVKRLAHTLPSPPTNQVQIDIDGAANPGIVEMKDEIFLRYKSITAIGTSVKGKGLFILFNTDGLDYEGSFRAICRDLEELSIVIDDSVSSINELRYMTLNNEVMVRESPDVYTDKLDKPRKSSVDAVNVSIGNIALPPGLYLHYRDATKYVGRCNALGIPFQDCLNELLADGVFDPSSHLATDRGEIEVLVKKIYTNYSDQFASINPLPSANTILREEKKTAIESHLFLIPSIKANNKYAHVIIDKSGVAEYFESTSGGKISEPAKTKISEIMKSDWPKIKNEDLKVFNPDWIQRDERDCTYIYYRNGTVCITKDGYTFSERTTSTTIWRSLVLDRDFREASTLHHVAELAQKCTVDYKAFQIGMGYLLHRYWFRNITKVVWASDHQPKAGHDGRRGKDLFTTLVQEIRKLTAVKWKRGHNFWTGSITPETSIVHFEDTSNYLISDDEIKKAISGTLNIEGKGRDIVTVQFQDKPKFSASCQTMPADYADASIRGRVWLIEFNDYLQLNPPKKILVYDDKDKSTFDKWIIECVTVYFQNIDSMIGTPELTDAQKNEVARIKFGANMVEAVILCFETLNLTGSFSAKEVHESLGSHEKDSRIIDRFKRCFEVVTGKKLVKKNKMANGVRGYFFELEEKIIETKIEPKDVPF